MSLQAIFAFILFAFVSSITPGPNNLMLFTSGMNFGFRASIPHIFGIAIGFFLMVAAVGLGLAEVFARYPFIYVAMKFAGTIYLLYLAWRIASAGPVTDDGPAKGEPLSFSGAALFQWVNPKAWAMAISAFSMYVPSSANWILVLAMSGLFSLVGLPCIMAWTLFGTGLKRWLQQPLYARIFNVAMALLLIVSLLPMLGAFQQSLSINGIASEKIR